MSASNRKSILLFFVLIGLLLTASAGSASTVTVGPNDFEETRSLYPYHRWLSGWWIGPVEIRPEADGGYWTKELHIPKRVDQGQPLTMVEVLKVGSGLSWTGWQERFLSDNWDWTSGRAFVVETEGLKRSQLLLSALGPPSVSGTISQDASTLTFSFQNPLDEGDRLVILCTFTWEGDNTHGRPQSLLVAQSPVPIPGAAWLLGSGILGLIVIRRRSHK